MKIGVKKIRCRMVSGLELINDVVRRTESFGVDIILS